MPPNDNMAYGPVQTTLVFVLGTVPKCLLLDLRRDHYTADDFLKSPRKQIADYIVRELDARGFRIVKGFLSDKPSGKGYGWKD